MRVMGKDTDLCRERLNPTFRAIEVKAQPLGKWTAPKEGPPNLHRMHNSPEGLLIWVPKWIIEVGGKIQILKSPVKQSM